MDTSFVMLAKASIHLTAGADCAMDAGLRQHDWWV